MFPIQDTVQARNPPLITWTLILLNTLVFLFEVRLPPENLEAFVRQFGMIPARLGTDASSYFTLVTSMFLHGGWAHIISNMWTLYLFGDNVEDRMGPARYLVFYLLCGLAAGLTHYAISPASTLPSLGASGAIAGVLGAYFLLYPTARIIAMVPILIFPFFFEVPAFMYFLVWFLTQLLSGTLSILGPEQLAGGIAWWAHIGGFAAGLVLLPLFLQPQKQYRRFYADEQWAW
jgi:membrane associated rhomboid family serine protease